MTVHTVRGEENVTGPILGSERGGLRLRCKEVKVTSRYLVRAQPADCGVCTRGDLDGSTDGDYTYDFCHGWRCKGLA